MLFHPLRRLLCRLRSPLFLQRREITLVVSVKLPVSFRLPQRYSRPVRKGTLLRKRRHEGGD